MSDDHPPDKQQEVANTQGPIVPNDSAQVAHNQRPEPRNGNEEHDELIRKAQQVQANSSKVIAWLTAALVLVSVTSAGVSYLQFQAAKNSADASLSAALASIQQARDAGEANWLNRSNSINSERQSNKTFQASVDQFRLEQRAWVGVEHVASTGFTDRTIWTVTVTFVNSGKTPAKNVEVSAAYVVSPVSIAGPSMEEVTRLHFGPAQSIAPEGRYSMELGPIVLGHPVFRPEIKDSQTLLSSYEAIKAGRLFLYYYGILKYKDAFGGHRQTQFCIFLANTKTKDAAFCDSFNDLN
ncbi:MAG: hypothetical protein ACRDHZ_05075 [Ktedonobacteraceae bacterium]